MGMNPGGASTSSLPNPRPSTTRPEDLDEESRTFSALGSTVRMRILSSIASREKSISELARELRVHRVTLRYHLGYLRNQGLIEEVTPSGPRRVGRPAALYRTSKHKHILGFPQRRFELLGQLALEALVEATGKEAASDYLRIKGAKAGRTLIAELGVKERVERWTPETFDRIVLHDHFRDLGIPSEVLSKSTKILEYRSFSCPFLELAEKMPDLVCNSLDAGFHRGIGEAMGGVRTERLACMGHGDPYCQYRLTWKAKAVPRVSRKSKGSRKPKPRGQT